MAVFLLVGHGIGKGAQNGHLENDVTSPTWAVRSKGKFIVQVLVAAQIKTLEYIKDILQAPK
jgi:hypothetical protein